VRAGREMVVRFSFLSGNDFKFAVAVVERFACLYPSFFAVCVYVASDLRVEFIKCRFEKGVACLNKFAIDFPFFFN
jgi:hypothetical protein